MNQKQQWGILVISHGSRNPEWVLMVDESICKLNIPQHIPLDSSFLEAVEGRTIQDGINQLEQRGVTDLVVVPLFISSGSTHMEEIQYALGIIPESSIETDIERVITRTTIHFCQPINDDPLIADICFEKISALSEQSSAEILLMIGHGSDEAGFGERWQEMLAALTTQVQALGRFAHSYTATLHPDDIAEKITELQQIHPGYQIIIAPLFLSEGYFTKKVIPARIGESKGVRYNGQALLPHPNITRWMERQIQRFI